MFVDYVNESGTVIRVPRQTPQSIADSRSTTANKIADIIGTCGGFVFKPEAGLEGAMGRVKGVKGVQGFVARKIENLGNKAAGYKVEWLVLEEKAVDQLTRLFERENIDITVKYYPE